MLLLCPAMSLIAGKQSPQGNSENAILRLISRDSRPEVLPRPGTWTGPTTTNCECSIEKPPIANCS